MKTTKHFSGAFIKEVFITAKMKALHEKIEPNEKHVLDAIEMLNKQSMDSAVKESVKDVVGFRPR